MVGIGIKGWIGITWKISVTNKRLGSNPVNEEIFSQRKQSMVGIRIKGSCNQDVTVL